MSRKTWARILLVSGALVSIGSAIVVGTIRSRRGSLVSMSMRIYTNSVVHAREAVLRDDLFTMRSVIDQYTLDRQKAPQSLQDLVSAGYLKAIPKDPLTGSTDTWRVTTDDTLIDPSQTQPGITDVHSGASGTGTDGSAYSSW